MKSINNIRLAVLGHIEWVSFISVETMPTQGLITHGNNFLENAAGGGAVAAVQMSKLTNQKVHFFTSLGNDSIGHKCFKELSSLGIELHTVWKEKPTRRAFSFVDKNGDRAITVVGERLQPSYKDSLPWDMMENFDAVFITAGDSEAINACREAKIVCATPRVKIKALNEASIQLDALIASKLDPDEQIKEDSLYVRPKFIIKTEGALGGLITPGGRYEAVNPGKEEVDSYGCGDSFAAGVTAGLAANLEIKEAVQLGAKCGAECASHFGAYNK
ncbi:MULTISPECIES: PfkB family carbohydrate kinase [unclassified Prochlorococcus]|uniref:PfkB family carbohydrate kinase n=1 Tax=unclassified Prochlorococcus TaxID=2627481 RepID=UPI0005339518|nr:MULTISPECIES: PfkB family carbohydrate kinase [unclassified Prochlorococcus]KGG15485.1 Ribokinase [Prochlorococcus sp. MIT 0602]KGG17765.1 Ribokinase [Prochlorococcus sp. MIT 0603]